jgi:uncharacterized membrane protein
MDNHPVPSFGTRRKQFWHSIKSHPIIAALIFAITVSWAAVALIKDTVEYTSWLYKNWFWVFSWSQSPLFAWIFTILNLIFFVIMFWYLSRADQKRADESDLVRREMASNIASSVDIIIKKYERVFDALAGHFSDVENLRACEPLIQKAQAQVNRVKKLIETTIVEENRISEMQQHPDSPLGLEQEKANKLSNLKSEVETFELNIDEYTDIVGSEKIKKLIENQQAASEHKNIILDQVKDPYIRSILRAKDFQAQSIVVVLQECMREIRRRMECCRRAIKNVNQSSTE